MKKTPRPPTTKRVAVPRPILAMATPPADKPKITIERLKGGEINWSRTAPTNNLPRILAEARQLIDGCLDLEAYERGRREDQREALAAQRQAAEAARKAAEAREGAGDGP